MAEAMKNEEFKKLLFDYMQEISDPDNRKVQSSRYGN
jgi:hypothetical protein